MQGAALHQESSVENPGKSKDLVRKYLVYLVPVASVVICKMGLWDRLASSGQEARQRTGKSPLPTPGWFPCCLMESSQPVTWECVEGPPAGRQHSWDGKSGLLDPKACERCLSFIGKSEMSHFDPDL